MARLKNARLNFLDRILIRFGYVPKRALEGLEGAISCLSNELEKSKRELQNAKTEIQQLKAGQAANEDDWKSMEKAVMNEFKFRQFKANLVAHKKLVQMAAGELAKFRNTGISGPQCLELAEMLEPNYGLYISDASQEKLKKDIIKLIGKSNG